MNAIETVKLTKHYGAVPALKGLDLVVAPGEIHGLLGMNGAGKTTTMDILATLSRPTAGTARVAGYDVASQPDEVRRRIGVVFEGNQPGRPHWTGGEYLQFFADVCGKDGVPQDVLQELNLAELLPKEMGKMSGGQKKRIELARALIHDPPVLLLDEPTKELDLKTKRAVWEAFRSLAAKRGTTILLSSHDALEMSELCSRITVLARGEVTLSLSPAALRQMDAKALEATLVAKM